MTTVEAALVAQYKYFSQIQVWPVPAKMDLDGWLRNFESTDRELASKLASEVIYFSERHCEALMLDALRRISSHLVAAGKSFLQTQDAWNTILDRAYLLPVADAQRGAESGFLYSYKARQLGLPDKQVLHPETGLDRLRYMESAPLIIVDDLVLTGQKFLSFMTRPIAVPNGTVYTYGELIAARPGPTVLCCMVGSQYGLGRIATEYPRVVFSVANVLDETVCLGDPSCTLFPADVLAEMHALIARASDRAKIPVSNRYGFDGKGFLIGLHHNTPDATLPIIWWSQNGWRPLLARL